MRRAIGCMALMVLVTLFGFPDSSWAARGDITLVGWYRVDGGCGMSDVYGWYDMGELSGNPGHYAVIGQFPDNLYIVDVEDPASPQLKSVINSFPIYDMKVWSVLSPFKPYHVYAYGASGAPYCGPETVIYEITKPGNPTFVGTTQDAHNLAMSDSGFMFHSRGTCDLEAYDLNTDPTNPVFVFKESTVIPGATHSHDTMPKGNLVYDFSAVQGVDIYDISGIGGTPSVVTRVANIPHGDIDPLDPSSGIGRGAHSGDVTADGNFLYICDEYNTILAGTPYGGPEDIFVYDISDPMSPFLVDTIVDPDAGVHNLLIRNDLAVVSFFSAGFRVYDVSDPANGTPLLDEYDTNDATGEGTPYGPWGVYIDGRGYVYVSDRQNGLFIFAVEGLSPSAGSASGPPYTPGISGTVTYHTGAPYPGVTLEFSDQCEPRYVTTDASGHYEHYVPYGWQGTVTIGPGFKFVATGETTVEYSSVTTFLTNQNWTRNPPCRGCPDPIQEKGASVGADEVGVLSSVPNPFNPSTTIRFRLGAPGAAELSIYDLAGRLVRSASLPYRQAGSWDWEWDGRADTGDVVAAGVYVVRLTAGHKSYTHRVTLLK